MKERSYQSLYQVNTRVLLTDLSRRLGHPTTLDDLPDSDLDHWAELGFDWIWMLSVWRTGPSSRKISRSNPDWRREFEETLPDLSEEDIGGSGFAITGYTVHDRLGGDEALARLRDRLRIRGLKLMLDFVPNHTALDHPWVEEHPGYYVSGSELDLARAPRNYTWVNRKKGDLLLAHGRDPYFPGWPDTLQLNYGQPNLQKAMIEEMRGISKRCDGVRCDMAMLVVPEVFERTWGIPAAPFWPQAIEAVRKEHPSFVFMAEVYWDMEWILQQQGFDYTYDKRLYDRLREGNARPVREHFLADLNFQNNLARFLENHDEPRAAASFAPELHEAAAVLTFLSPGLRFFHQGQLEGRIKRISPHLVRGPEEPIDRRIQEFYTRLLAVLRRPEVRTGDWRLLECRSAWDGNAAWDHFIAFGWEGHGERMIVAVNDSPQQSQCYVSCPFSGIEDRNLRLTDLLGPSVYDRTGKDLTTTGLYLDLPPWGYHVFEVRCL